MSKKSQILKDKYRHYYKSILLQFMGLEIDLKYHNQHSVSFIFNKNRYILWMASNKINDCKNGRWIINTDKYIIENMLKEKNIPLF